MMLPNLISVSVMPGCWAGAVVAAARESSAENNRAGVNLLDRIMLHLPGEWPMTCYWFWTKARSRRGNRSCVELLDAAGAAREVGATRRMQDNASRSTQVCAGQIGAL